MAEVVDSAARIRFSPKILRRLGEELNPSMDQGIIELVKNAYDANATACDVWLDSHPSHPGSVVIEDDGDGMSERSIVDGWLVLGGSAKESIGKTRLGRTPAGNKGLGRLAALRLGRHARLESRPGDGFEYRVDLDWEQFDEVATVDDVELVVVRNPTDRPNGTRIVLSDLRQQVGRLDARRLARALVMLTDPFDETDTSFSAVLHSQEFADLAAQVSGKYFDEAVLQLEAKLEGGFAKIWVKDWRGEVLWSDALDNKVDGSVYKAPDCDFNLWAFSLSAKEFLSRSVPLKSVREWLASFGGVHVYVNDLRVGPYGNPGDDWLSINLARARSPELRPSTNNSIGRLRVEDPEDLLKQKTDRSGFLETEAFDELRRFATDALNWMAARRTEEAELKRQADRKDSAAAAKQSASTVTESIDKISDGDVKDELQQVFAKYQKDRDREADALRREVQLYRTLSTAGITAATFAHESHGNPLKIIDSNVSGIERRLRKEPALNFEKYEAALGRVRTATTSLGVLSAATLELIKSDKRRRSKVLLNDVVKGVCSTFEPFLNGRHVDLDLDLGAEGAPFVNGSIAAVESIITNLINNALDAFERSESPDRVLRVSTRMQGTDWVLRVSDSGPGILDLSLTEIWLPGNTVRSQGTGLGLTIVRDSASDLGGSATADATGELGGAVFTVVLPTTGVDNAPLF